MSISIKSLCLLLWELCSHLQWVFFIYFFKIRLILPLTLLARNTYLLSFLSLYIPKNSGKL